MNTINWRAGVLCLILIVFPSIQSQAQTGKSSGYHVLKTVKLGGEGGLIPIDKHGNIALPFNTSGMYRGYVDPDGKLVVKIYK